MTEGDGAMTRELPIGCAGNGVVHTDQDLFDIDTRFRMVKEAGVFDYYDKSPLMGEVDAYLLAKERHGLPIRATGWYYVLGRDEPLLEWNLRVSAQLGAVVHNTQVSTKKLDGSTATDQEVVDAYLRAYDIGKALGVDPCFEVHVNMWSEHLGRIATVGRMVEARGVPFNMTLDHSHVIFKMENPKEQEVQGMKADIDAGRLVLDPYRPGNVAQALDRGGLCAARACPGGSAGQPGQCLGEASRRQLRPRHPVSVRRAEARRVARPLERGEAGALEGGGPPAPAPSRDHADEPPRPDLDRVHSPARLWRRRQIFDLREQCGLCPLAARDLAADPGGDRRRKLAAVSPPACGKVEVP